MNMLMNSNPSISLGQRAEDQVARLFDAHGWKVRRAPVAAPYEADLVVSKGRQRYVVEVKALSEGRSDRVLPLLSQAILQAKACARENGVARPLAIVYVGDASPALLQQIGEFSKRFAQDVAVGIVSESGSRRFLGEGSEGLESLNAEPHVDRKAPSSPASRGSLLFSDLNQWMLKVLLAPQIPERLLAAPRAEYRNVSQLAKAAGVSAMSAFRFVDQLRKEGFLDDSSSRLELVRREALFSRWQSAAFRPSPEMSMRFLIRGSAQEQLREILPGHHACLGLFAAAAALKLGHVGGVPPHVYVPRLPRMERDIWKELVPASAGEPVDLMLKQASAPQSVFRGAVNVDAMAVSDVLQVWLDVAAHPSPGEEQAELIHRKILRPIIEEGRR